MSFGSMSGFLQISSEKARQPAEKQKQQNQRNPGQGCTSIYLKAYLAKMYMAKPRYMLYREFANERRKTLAVN